MRLIVLLLITWNCSAQKFFAGATVEYQPYDLVEGGLTFGMVHKSIVTETSYTISKTYSHIALNFVGLLEPFGTQRNSVGFGFRTELFNERYLAVRPIMQCWFKLNKYQYMKGEVTMRRGIPDITASYIILFKPEDDDSNN